MTNHTQAAELKSCPFCGELSNHRSDCWFELRDIGASRGRLNAAWNRRAASLEAPSGEVVAWIDGSTLARFIADGNCHREFQCSIRRGEAVCETDVALYAAPPASTEPSTIAARAREHAVVEVAQKCECCGGKGGWATESWVDPVSGPECESERCTDCDGTGVYPPRPATQEAMQRDDLESAGIVAEDKEAPK
ncbi:MAG TPA: hypothetical protein VFW00_06550 [Rhodocyclaceae bacterium]|nr:hypothetical protein [Rhodocyclaceae bacterium]